MELFVKNVWNFISVLHVGKTKYNDDVTTIERLKHGVFFEKFKLINHIY